MLNKIRTVGNASTSASKNGKFLGSYVSVDVSEDGDDNRYFTIINNGEKYSNPIKLNHAQLMEWDSIDERLEMKFAFKVCGLECGLFSSNAEWEEYSY